ncbi:MAG TPA: hypothetical protein VMT31_07435 [Methanomicrobiales archaeon]|jgi:hypothetical protein|nr:hypothetical protein [Methanomicrobiales archaeon]
MSTGLIGINLLIMEQLILPDLDARLFFLAIGAVIIAVSLAGAG